MKVWKPGRDENTQEDYPTSVAHTIKTMKCVMQQMQGSFLVHFNPTMFPYFLQVHPYMQ